MEYEVAAGGAAVAVVMLFKVECSLAGGSLNEATSLARRVVQVNKDGVLVKQAVALRTRLDQLAGGTVHQIVQAPPNPSPIIRMNHVLVSSIRILRNYCFLITTHDPVLQRPAATTVISLLPCCGLGRIPANGKSK